MVSVRAVSRQQRLTAASRTPRAQARWQKVGHWLLPWLIPLGGLVLWWVAVTSGWIQPYQLPLPTTILRTFTDLVIHGELARHMQATLQRLAVGYILGAVFGVALGMLAGMSKTIRRVVDPTIQGVRAVPSLAWVPLFLLWFGIGERARVLLIALGVFLPVYFNTLAGVGGVDWRLVEVGYVYRLGRWKILRTILLPGALPGILTGLRSGLSLGWMFVVAAELLAASTGLGFLLVEGQSTMRPDRVIVALLLFAILGRFSDALLGAVEHALLQWRETVATAGQEEGS